MKSVVKKLKRLDQSHKVILGIGFPVLIILLVAGTTSRFTGELNIGGPFGIDPFNIEESWWVWFIVMLSIMLFEWVLFARGKGISLRANRTLSDQSILTEGAGNEDEYSARLMSSGNHPWRRYFSRLIDISIFGNTALILLVIMVNNTYPGLIKQIYGFEQGAKTIVFTMLLFGIWVPVETVLLSTIGTTPAKWLFGILVTSTAGQRLSFAQALSRSLSVWARGLCLGISPLILFSMLFSLNRLNVRGQTYWDETYHMIVRHKVWGFWRATFCFLSVIVVLLIAAILQGL
ncbi:MAG: RDD family protein [Desulfobacterales bacterium]|nr:RDD family protein [Desulfobacterales bacterium]